MATQNQGKLKEFQQLSKGMDFEFIAIPEELQEMPEETGKTFKENAFIKARYVSEYFQMPALADDSGLEVDALNGDPGVYSARYSSSGSDLDNCKKLLSNMRGIAKESRTARFKCCLLGFNQGETVVAEGALEGEIAEEFKGEKGFGYDPIFLVPEYKLHLAEMEKEDKNKISHRFKAFEVITDSLPSLIN
ncbi:MAG TPA: RdgB/HAM1 family non-canonical purine NTP pyrophosphatase [SAR86 cluster bacterium]|nr:RdgB/HAM1 family non-canonical purine NTP pyrophosphatase [SAR86 cluster bacterium]